MAENKRERAAREVIERAQREAAKKGRSTEEAARGAAEQLRKAHRSKSK